MAETKSFSIDVDDKTFTRNSKKFLNDLNKVEKGFIREQSSLLARDLAKYTPPWATLPTKKGNSVGTAKDIRVGKEAVKSDLQSICKVRKKSTINKLKKGWKGGAVMYRGRQIGHGIIEDEKALSNWHYSKRTARGRTGRVTESMRPFVPSVLFNKYVRKRQADVGISKATFYRSSLQLGGKHNAVKAIKLGLRKANGTGSVKKEQKGYEGTVQGSSPGALHTKERFLGELQNDRKIKAEKRLRIIANAEAKKAKLNDK